MLSRVARQKNALFHLRRSSRTSSATLQLRAHSSRPTTIVHTFASDQHDRPRQPSFQSNRNLATTTDQPPVDQGSYVPFDDSPYSVGGEYNPPDRWASLFPGPSNEFDPSSLVIMDNFLQTKPKVVRKFKGASGNEEEMMANLDISLKVGQFERAAALVNRLGMHFPVGSPDYLAVHNRYMEAMVSNMILIRQHDMVWPLQKWFEVDMPNAKVKPDAVSYAIMLKMALRMLHGTKRDRTVRRYWQLAKNQEVEEELLAVPVLSELELGELSEICSPDLQRVGLDNLEHEAARSTQLSTADEHDRVPHVRPVEQKGLGLSSLRESLSLFSGKSNVSYPADPGLTAEEKREMYEVQRQRQLEADSIKSAMDRWRQEFDTRQKAGADATAGGKRLSPMMTQWYTDLVTKLKEELKLVAEAEAAAERSQTAVQKERCSYGPYLRSLETDKLAALTIVGVMSAFSKQGITKGIKLSFIATAIGKDVQDELLAKAALEKDTVADARRRNMLKRILSGRKEKQGRIRWNALVRRLQQDEPTIFWPPTVIAKVGAVLMSLLFEAGKAPVMMDDPDTKQKVLTMQPAFQHSYQIYWGRRTGLIHLHPAVGGILSKEPTADLLGRQLPMVCKPKPWTSVNNGGYHLYRSSIVRSVPGETLQPVYVKAAMENNGLSLIREGLDVLGTTGWSVNREVFDVMVDAWNTGKAIGGLAPLEPDLPIPPKPSPEDGYNAERNWNDRVRDLENQRSGYHSVRCFQNFQMEVARAYRNEEFYFPHNLDFRGRAYPLPPYLNQMGADNARGLLLFSEAKPLGESGLKWLKVHLANLAGFDKASLSEREKFTMDHLDDIVDSADNGLHGRQWWLKAEEPWQCLAACFELRNALHQPDPTQYLSRLPIHQDGSCNGLQHYAALGGDSIGAQQVNLEPSDRPSDVYTGVAEFVKESVAREAAGGNPTAQLLEGKITRKVVKQTVMTNVYGVTFLGAIRQVRRQLVDHYPELHKDELTRCSVYVARTIFEALSSMFSGAHEIQYWLGDCASRITQALSPEHIEELAKEVLTTEKATTALAGLRQGRGGKKDKAESFKSTVIWTTPLGLPVVQPYWSRKARRITTSFQDLSVMDASSESVVSRRKQLQAFPPNFIHSLDATHMMLSANACRKAGLTFSAVHDSFWTHASDVDSMNHILREAFVRMHSDDVVQRLAEEFKVRYGNHVFLAKVDRGSKVGRAVRQWRKHRGARMTKTQELLEEYKRQKLLQSDDPELQAQGREMQTAAAIFEQLEGAEKDLDPVNAPGATQIGHVPENLADAERAEYVEKQRGMDTGDGSDEGLMDVNMPEASGEGTTATTTTTTTGARRETDERAEEPKKKDTTTRVWLWLPMFFPKIPGKGEWDLTRIRKSQYFFS